MNEIFRPDATEAILYDPQLFNEPAAISFEPDEWPGREQVVEVGGGGGRGATYFVADDHRRYALRRYYRGGLPRYFLRDRYFWQGEEATRSFREWRLLDKLRQWQLPAPRAAAARFRRHSFLYSADILTVRLAGVRALSGVLSQQTLSETGWGTIGSTIAKFHRRGVCHADLNAHNIQIDEANAVYLLDFDKGTVRGDGSWRAGNLSRLNRSLEKISAADSAVDFSPRQWGWLQAGYDSAFSSA